MQKEIQLFDIVLADAGDLAIIIDHDLVVKEKNNACLPASISFPGTLTLTMPSGDELVFNNIAEHLLKEMQLVNGFILASADQNQDTPTKLWLCSAGGQ